VARAAWILLWAAGMHRRIRPAHLYLADGPTPAEVADELRTGRVDDLVFDRYLPEPMRRASANWWTPLPVVREIAGWLNEAGVRSILDIGSGVGKFCVATALLTNIQCIGLEHRFRLLGAARDLARIFDVEGRARFIYGALGERPLPAVDAFYLYNPFGENLFGDAARLDGTVELGADRFVRDIELVKALLHHAPIGFHAVVYNGFGGRMPEGFELLRTERRRAVKLELWRKTAHDEVTHVELTEVLEDRQFVEHGRERSA
jgi:hypothetical protein